VIRPEPQDRGFGSSGDTSNTPSPVSREPRGHGSGWRAIARRFMAGTMARSTNPPWFDARGVAIGLAVGFGLPLGSQMLCLGLLRLAFRFNSLVAFACTWVNNPVTLLPMYYGYYCLGSFLLGKPPVMNVEAFRELMRPIMDAGHFWDSMAAFADLSLDFIARWAISAALVGIASGVIGYVLAYYVQRRRCLVRARALGTSYEMLLKERERGLRESKSNKKG